MSGTPTSGLLDDIVRDSRLETHYGGGLTIHLRNDPHAPPLTPKRQERWKRVHTLGKGGQGQVVLEKCVDDKPILTERAVKKIRLQTDDSRRRYEEELRTILKFSHDNYSQYFVKSFGWYTSETNLYLPMEYLPAGDLSHYVLGHERLSEHDCREIVCQIVWGLALMHAEGFAHRDVNPHNILIKSHPRGDNPGSWWVKLADFGISKRLGTDINATTDIPGTRLYMAPELINQVFINPPRNDYLKADVWSLGITAVFILTKNNPSHNPSSLQEYGRNPAVPFPSGLLDHYQISEVGQDFIRQVTKPLPEDRIAAEEAKHLKWIEAFLPKSPILNAKSWPSTVSSTHSSFDGSEWLTPEIGTLASQPTSRGIHSLPDPRPIELQTPSSSNSEAITLHGSLVGHESESQPSIQGVVSYKDLADALRTGNVEVAKTLINSNFNIVMNHGWTPLHLSVFYNSVQVTEYLIQNGANIHATRDNGNTPLHVAACNGHEAVTRHLLKNGAPIEAKTDLGYTPLHVAAYKGYHIVAKVLLESGADVKAKDKWGRTSLLLATGKGFTAVVRRLLEHDAETEVRNEEQETPLILAVKEDHVDMVKMLLEKNADVEAMDREGKTSLMIAMQKKNKALVKPLAQNGAKKGLSYYRNRFSDLV